MAKISKGFSSAKSTIYVNQLDGELEIKLVEETKDGSNVYDLVKILKEWNEIAGISFNISLKEELEPDETEF